MEGIGRGGADLATEPLGRHRPDHLTHGPTRPLESPVVGDRDVLRESALARSQRNDDGLPNMTYPGEHPPGSLYWNNGRSSSVPGTQKRSSLVSPKSLSAYLIGDEGERYYADGTVRRPDEFPPDNPPGEAPEEQPAAAPQEPRTVTAAQADAIRAWHAAKGHPI